MTAADATGEPALRSFVTGLRADQDAVSNGLSLRWSSGAVEGHVTFKMLKRQMYGRAGPDLLRRRILLADQLIKRAPQKVCQNQYWTVADTCVDAGERTDSGNSKSAPDRDSNAGPTA